jgi:hypothetical protein
MKIITFLFLLPHSIISYLIITIHLYLSFNNEIKKEQYNIVRNEDGFYFKILEKILYELKDYYSEIQKKLKLIPFIFSGLIWYIIIKNLI